MGGYSRSRSTFDHFVAANKHEMFRHPREAQVSSIWFCVILSEVQNVEI
jgi:hypothetical protein